MCEANRNMFTLAGDESRYRCDKSAFLPMSYDRMQLQKLPRYSGAFIHARIHAKRRPTAPVSHQVFDNLATVSTRWASSAFFCATILLLQLCFHQTISTKGLSAVSLLRYVYTYVPIQQQHPHPSRCKRKNGKPNYPNQRRACEHRSFFFRR